MDLFIHALQLCHQARLLGRYQLLSCPLNGLERYRPYSMELSYHRSLVLLVVILCTGIGRHIKGALVSRSSGLGDMSHLSLSRFSTMVSL